MYYENIFYIHTDRNYVWRSQGKAFKNSAPFYCILFILHPLYPQITQSLQHFFPFIFHLWVHNIGKKKQQFQLKIS